jgi:hypothetical protein
VVPFGAQGAFCPSCNGAAPDPGRASAVSYPPDEPMEPWLRGSTSSSLPAFERNCVRTVGVITSGLVAVGALMATAVALKSIPDIRHYRRIRNM